MIDYLSIAVHAFTWFFFFYIIFICSQSIGWNNKIVVLKKTRQLYFKTFIEKIISGNLIM